MTKPPFIKIVIPNPCLQSWDEMTPEGQGRFCAHCNKTVIDFTMWSDAALYNFFSKDKGPTCGRFLGSQLDRPINIPQQPHSRLYRMFVGLGLVLIFTIPADAQVIKTAPLVTTQTEQCVMSPERISKDGKTRVYGTITDNRGEPLANAAVQVLTLNNVGTVTDLDGKFSIELLVGGWYNVKVSYTGFL